MRGIAALCHPPFHVPVLWEQRQCQHLSFPVPGRGLSPEEVQGWEGCGVTPLCSLTDGERPGEVTDPGRRPAAAPVSARRRKAEDSSESHEEDPMVTGLGRGLGGSLVWEQSAPSVVQLRVHQNL